MQKLLLKKFALDWADEKADIEHDWMNVLYRSLHNHWFLSVYTKEIKKRRRHNKTMVEGEKHETIS